MPPILEVPLINGQRQEIQVHDLFRYVSKVQAIRAVHSEEFGNILVLDDELQLASSDEGIYHYYLVNPAMECIARHVADKVDVLILGGGDGFALRQVLASPSVRKACLVDHDGDLVNLFAYGELGSIFGTSAAFKDPRSHCVFADAERFLDEQFQNDWRVYIIDLTDDWTNDTSLESILRKIDGGSGSGALVAMNLGALVGDGTAQLARVANANVRILGAFCLTIPSYGEPWLCAMGMAGKWDSRPVFDLAYLNRRADRTRSKTLAPPLLADRRETGDFVYIEVEAI